MKINRLEAENFRNLKEIQADFEDVNIIYGKNAQGKTNLIEAIYLFTGARSFRGTRDSEMIRFGSEKARLKIEFEGGGRTQTAEIETDGKKKVKLNGIAKKSVCALGEEIKAVVFSPAHLMLIKGGPAERRRFADDALSQIKSNYSAVLRSYGRALQQRNIVLKDISISADLRSMLYVWDASLAKEGAKMIYQRQKYLEALTPFVKEIFGGISGGTEEITLKLAGEFDYENLSQAEIENRLLKILNENQNNDILNKITKAGPHRDDIEILINGRSARIYGSQGQQRSCVLALKLAEASLLYEKTGIKPAALLDDVMSELDEKRQDYILNHLKDWQVFITCCDAQSVLRLKQGKTIKIENGTISEG